MQNIPSHALDIRHMFRASPENEEIIDVMQPDELNDDQDSVVVLSGVDKVQDEYNEWRSVFDLKEGDKILDGRDETSLLVVKKLEKIKEGKVILHIVPQS